MSARSPAIESVAADAWNAFPANALIEREKQQVILRYQQAGAGAVIHLLREQAPVFHDAVSGPYQEVGRWMDSVAAELEKSEPRILPIREDIA